MPKKKIMHKGKEFNVLTIEKQMEFVKQRIERIRLAKEAGFLSHGD